MQSGQLALVLVSGLALALDVALSFLLIVELVTEFHEGFAGNRSAARFRTTNYELENVYSRVWCTETADYSYDNGRYADAGYTFATSSRRSYATNRYVESTRQTFASAPTRR